MLASKLTLHFESCIFGWWHRNLRDKSLDDLSEVPTPKTELKTTWAKFIKQVSLQKVRLICVVSASHRSKARYNVMAPLYDVSSSCPVSCTRAFPRVTLALQLAPAYISPAMRRTAKLYITTLTCCSAGGPKEIVWTPPKFARNSGEVRDNRTHVKGRT